MSLHRRELLASLGVASASTLLAALGCRAPAPTLRPTPQVSGEVRTWLHQAVERLAVIYPAVHALAVSRRRTIAALDVLGAGLTHQRTEGVVLSVQTRDGRWREHVTSALTEAGIAAAATSLGATRKRKPTDFGRAPAPSAEPPRLDERDLRQRLEPLLRTDARLAARIVYAAARIEIDDAIVWSIAPGRDLEQRLVRLRQAATRAAWNGPRPVVREIERAWTGRLDDQTLSADELTATSEAALEIMTPGGFDEDQRTAVLDPSVVAHLVDTVARDLLTTTAARRPPVARRTALHTHLAAPLFTVLDDPTAPAAYGGFAFDDEGRPAASVTLVEAGTIAARLERARRAGHLGPLEPSPSHLIVAPGAAAARDLQSDGILLEGGAGASYDPASDRIRLPCARARELRSGNTTGRVWPDVELVGSLTGLLSAIDAVARDPIQLALGDRWTSISAPAIRTRGLVRARRSRA